MRPGHLSEYFTGVAAKRLSAVEADPSRSNQHEFDGVSRFRAILGDVEGDEKRRYTARFLYLSDETDDPVVADGVVTWYDARAQHPTRTEYRLYFQSSPVMELAEEGDLLITGLRPDGSLLLIVADAGSTAESQFLWMFGIDSEDVDLGYVVRTEADEDSVEVGFAAKLILENLGVEIAEAEPSLLDTMLNRFDGVFPKTSEFSEFARETSGQTVEDGEPDAVLVRWMEHEEKLFRTLERHIVGERLATAFSDVDEFIAYSLSVQNRRKSRAGLALENHLSAMFTAYRLRFDRGRETENRAKPDFLFPGIAEYHDADFPEVRLTMLGSKATCKDRWRQVLSEARRIEQKHLFTLEPGISENQTSEMRSHNLQLVLPATLHPTFTDQQRTWLLNLGEFIDLVGRRQTS